MKILYQSRAQWGADTSIPRLGWPIAPTQRTEVFIHHTVAIDNDATPNVFETMAEIHYWMRRLQKIRPDLGLDVPYNYVVFFMPGAIVICEGRGAHRSGAHTIGHNTSAIGMAAQGNFNLPTFGLTAYLPAVGEWLHRLKRTELPNLGSKHPAGRDCYGHRDVSQTACPGNHLYANIGLVKIQAPAPPPPPPEPPKEWDEMVTEAQLKKIVRDIVREETDSKVPLFKYDGLPGYVFSYDSSRGVLVHELNPATFLGEGQEWGDIVELKEGNGNHEEILGVPLLLPKGAKHTAHRLKSNPPLI